MFHLRLRAEARRPFEWLLFLDMGSLRQRARRSLQVLAIALLIFTIGVSAEETKVPDWQSLRNPLWTAVDNVRDPSVLKTADGYWIFYSRYTPGPWQDPKNWTVAAVHTRDFAHFEQEREVSPQGHASPGDVVQWRGRWVLPYQSYPASPVRLCYSLSDDLSHWTAPTHFLEAAAHLPWNEAQRVIDPSFVVQGETLHCFFVGSGFRKAADGSTVRGNLMGHAITRDPNLRDWQILTTNAPLIGFSERAPDGVENTMIFRTGANWTMIYSEGLADQHLAWATSSDLSHWSLQGPIPITRQKWNARKYGAPYVWREPEGWWMMLMGESAAGKTTFGLLHSLDGSHWIALPERE